MSMIVVDLFPHEAKRYHRFRSLVIRRPLDKGPQEREDPYSHLPSYMVRYNKSLKPPAWEMFKRDDPILNDVYVVRSPVGLLGNKIACREPWRVRLLTDGPTLEYGAGGSILLTDEQMTRLDESKLLELEDPNWLPSRTQPRFSIRIFVTVSGFHIEPLQFVRLGEIPKHGVEIPDTVYREDDYDSVRAIHKPEYFEPFLAVWDSMYPDLPSRFNPWTWTTYLKENTHVSTQATNRLRASSR